MAVKKTMGKKVAAKTSNVSTIKTVTPKAEMRKWEIESAMSTLQRAAEIQKNAKLMADVKKMAAEKAKEFNNLAAGKSI